MPRPIVERACKTTLETTAGLAVDNPKHGYIIPRRALRHAVLRGNIINVIETFEILFYWIDSTGMQMITGQPYNALAGATESLSIADGSIGEFDIDLILETI